MTAAETMSPTAKMQAVMQYNLNIVSTQAYYIFAIVLSLVCFCLISERLAAFLYNYALTRSGNQIW